MEKETMKKASIVVIVLMLIWAAYVLFTQDSTTSNMTLTINGETYSGPVVDMFGGLFGVLISMVVAVSVTILLFFIFSGVFVLLLGVAVFVGGILLSIALPFLAPVIIPLLVVMVFSYLSKRKKKKLQTS